MSAFLAAGVAHCQPSLTDETNGNRGSCTALDDLLEVVGAGGGLTKN